MAVRLRRPLEVYDAVRAGAFVDELLRRMQTESVRDALLAEGYDGVVVHFGPGDFWVVAYFGEQVRVVLEH